MLTFAASGGIELALVFYEILVQLLHYSLRYGEVQPWLKTGAQTTDTGGTFMVNISHQ